MYISKVRLFTRIQSIVMRVATKCTWGSVLPAGSTRTLVAFSPFRHSRRALGLTRDPATQTFRICFAAGGNALAKSCDKPAARELHASSSEAASVDYTLHVATGWKSRQQNHVLLQDRDWKVVANFWKRVVAGELSLTDLSPPLLPPYIYFPDLKPVPVPDWAAVQEQVESAKQSPTSHMIEVKANTSTSNSPSVDQESRLREDVSDTQESLISVEQPERRQKRRRFKEKGKSERFTYKVAVAYYGPAFDGWADQPGRDTAVTVERVLCDTIQPLIGDMTKAKAQGAGRTDKGVNAIAQVFSFYSWLPVPPEQLAHAISTTPQVPVGSLRMVASTQVPRTFHANFSAEWRRYVYLYPLNQHRLLRSSSTQQHNETHAAANMTVHCRGDQNIEIISHSECSDNSQQGDHINSTASSLTALQSPLATNTDEGPRLFTTEDGAVYEIPDIEACGGEVDPAVVHKLLQPLVGKSLDYFALARDTPKGKDTICTLKLARASLVYLPDCTEGVLDIQQEQQLGASVQQLSHSCDVQGTIAGGHVPVMCIELVGDRFLRKMVRVLVSTAVMEALALQRDMISQQRSSASAAKRDTPTTITPGLTYDLDCLDGDRWDAMLTHCQPDSSRQATGVAAPPEGLCFAGVGYDGVQPL